MGRPFNALRRQPDHCYDAVVVGAGIGGLTCANLLARAGMRVLLIEQHYMVGGYCSSFRHHGYTFDAATHFYPLLGNGATITGRLLADLDIRTRWIKMDPVDHFHFPDGSSFSVPADLDRYIARVKAEFPHEALAIDRFFALVSEAYQIGLLTYFRQRDTHRLGTYSNLTVRQVLDAYFRDQKLKLLLTADCSHWGSPPCRTSFVFDSMLRLAYFLGNYYPEGGSQAFADELARRFEEMGGHILMSSRVQKVLVRNSGAYGVEVEIGPRRARYVQQVQAGVVVSNADLLQTLEQMLGPECLDSGYLEPIRQLRPTYPCFITHIGVKDLRTEVLRECEGYYWESWDSDAVANGAFALKLFVPTLYEPKLAPPGGHIAIIQKVIELEYSRVCDWAAHKADVEQWIMAKLERLIPGFSGKVVVKLSASALTSYKYTLNHEGAMLGWEMSPEQVGEGRPGVVSPIRSLYFVGHWTQPGGGITPVIASAMAAAKAITQSGEAHLAGPTVLPELALPSLPVPHGGIPAVAG